MEVLALGEIRYLESGRNEQFSDNDNQSIDIRNLFIMQDRFSTCPEKMGQVQSLSALCEPGMDIPNVNT